MNFDPSKIKVIFFDAINTVFDVSGRPKEELREYVRQFEAKPYQPMKLPDAWEHLPAFPDSVEGIGMLTCGHRFAVRILSNVPFETINRIANRAGVTRRGGVAIPLEESRIYKPDPRAYVWAAGHVDEAPEHCLMVTANPRIGHADHGDVEAAASVGMPGVLIRNEGGPQTIVELAEMLGC
jgi:HAD superfamily hydrolase (TIGR01493 family)